MKEDWALKVALEIMETFWELRKESLAAAIAVNLKQQRQIGYLEGYTAKTNRELEKKLEKK